MKSADEEAQKILNAFPVFEDAERGKIRCTLTGHELPVRVELLDSYTKTPKFVRAFRIHEIMEQYGEYFDDLGENKYGCRLTQRIVAKDPDDLQRHVDGKKFKRALEKALKDVDESSTSDRSDEEMEEDEDPDFGNKDDSLSDDDERNDDYELYPELSKNEGDATVENDSYDFAVMDTEKDTNDGGRKRKADGSTGRKKKRAK